MSYAEDEVFPVPSWDSCEWDRVLLHRPDIGRTGGRGDVVFYRPGRLLVDARVVDDERVRGVLLDGEAERADEDAADVADALGLTLLVAPDDRVIDLVRGLRREIPSGASLDHVLVAGPARWHGDDLPVPVEDPRDIPGADCEAGAGLTVAVLDTGIDPKAPFPVQSGPGDAEIVDEDHDGRRDPPAGHGTHIAGLVARTAPGATVVAHRILRTVAGQASELEVAQALLDIGKPDLVNCSFSGTVLEDAQPIAVERALERLSPSTVVVACAGNTGTNRPQWPAASHRVIGVGAVGRAKPGDPWLRTDFSSFGSWVDCCAPGMSVHSAFLNVDAFSGWAAWSGTSMSCPQVVGAIAAVATRDRISVPLAAFKVARDPARPRVARLGTLVDPASLP
jgi:subtilisin family serine protease